MNAARSFTNCSKQNLSNEDQRLIPKKRPGVLKRRYCNASKCVKSKATWLALMLNFGVHIFYYSFISPTHYYSVHPELLSILVNAVFSTFIRCMYPLAGYLADNKLGRHRTIFSSFKLILPGVVVTLIGGVFLIARSQVSNKIDGEYHTILSMIGLLLVFAGFLLLIIGVIGFKANIIQFGLDQLFDSPWEDQVVFLYWFLWTSFCPRLIIHFVFQSSKKFHKSQLFEYSAIEISSIVTVTLIAAVLCIAKKNKTWFFTNLSTFNPYRLVYLITKFSCKHKIPVYRSAFTYCEDEIPSGLDLGKNKYGGPFTTEQVEDVKVFYGILKVLLAIGPAFTLFYICSPMISVLETHVLGKDIAMNKSSPSSWQSIGAMVFNATDQIFVVFFIPVHLILIRPLISYYTPGMLKTMGITMFMVLCAVFVLFGLDTWLHVQNKQHNCMFAIKVTANSTSNEATLETSVIASYFKYIGAVHRTILNLLVVFTHVALYKFICSQGPNSMKGLLIGLAYAVRALFDILGPLLSLLLGYAWPGGGFPSCGMVFYLLMIALGTVSLLVYVWVAKNYKYRMRDEPCHVRQFVEEYYYKYSR